VFVVCHFFGVMKRASELEESPKRTRKEETFIPLLNADLAEWKAKLRTNANPTTGEWKLVVYSEKDRALEQYGRYPYHPDIFSDKVWLVEDWALNIEGYSGECSTLAYADKLEDLVPGTLALKRIRLFRLPFMICPATFEPPNTLDKVYKDQTARLMIFNWSGIYSVDRQRVDLEPIAALEHPDLANSEHIEIIYKWWEGHCNMSSQCVQRIEQLKAKRNALCVETDKEVELCKAAQAMRECLILD
jgi:hypothetical protein